MIPWFYDFIMEKIRKNLRNEQFFFLEIRMWMTQEQCIWDEKAYFCSFFGDLITSTSTLLNTPYHQSGKKGSEVMTGHTSPVWCGYSCSMLLLLSVPALIWERYPSSSNSVKRGKYLRKFLKFLSFWLYAKAFWNVSFVVSLQYKLVTVG